MQDWQGRRPCGSRGRKTKRSFAHVTAQESRRLRRGKPRLGEAICHLSIPSPFTDTSGRYNYNPPRLDGSHAECDNIMSLTQMTARRGPGHAGWNRICCACGAPHAHSTIQGMGEEVIPWYHGTGKRY
jgi:hypothetical protein